MWWFLQVLTLPKGSFSGVQREAGWRAPWSGLSSSWRVTQLSSPSPHKLSVFVFLNHQAFFSSADPVWIGFLSLWCLSCQHMFTVEQQQTWLSYITQSFLYIWGFIDALSAFILGSCSSRSAFAAVRAWASLHTHCRLPFSSWISQSWCWNSSAVLSVNPVLYSFNSSLHTHKGSWASPVAIRPYITSEAQ